MVVYGIRADPTIEMYEDDGTIRGFYRVTNGFAEPIDWRDFYSLNWWVDEDDIQPPKKIPEIA